MARVTDWLEKHQVALYLFAIAIGATAGLTLPSAHSLEVAINPVLILLMYATFLTVPFHRIGSAVKDARFMVAALTVNFIPVPAVVWLLTRFITGDRVLYVAVLFVLLAPCIDYVIAFTRLAGGAADRLLVAAPVLMLIQMLVLALIIGTQVDIDRGPFLDALLWLIIFPLVLAIITHRFMGWFADTFMVILMMATLFVVVASQIGGVSDQLAQLAALIPLYIAFAAIMGPLGAWVARLLLLDAPARRAVTF